MTDDYEDEDAPVEALPGAVAGSGGPEELAAGLLEMAAQGLKIAVLLAEADEDDWRAISGRLDTFLGIVGQFPTKPKPRRRVGFQPPSKSKSKAKKPTRSTRRKHK